MEFRANAASMQVKPDPRIDAKMQAEIQNDMQEKVLQSVRYPEIVFRSARIEKEAEGRWRVDGTLTLHGITKQVSVPVLRSRDAYTGRVAVRQTDFGIKLVTAGAGTVKVRDELDIEFLVFTSK